MKTTWILTFLCFLSYVSCEKRLLEGDSILERVHQLELTVQALQSVVNAQSSQISDFQSKVNTKKQGCQSGSHVLADANGHAHAKTTTIKFNPPFDEPPKVVWGTIGLDIGQAHNTRYGSSISALSTTGFVFESHTWGDTELYSITIQWMACPAHI